jgi:hypothetical protein
MVAQKHRCGVGRHRCLLVVASHHGIGFFEPEIADESRLDRHVIW